MLQKYKRLFPFALSLMLAACGGSANGGLSGAVPAAPGASAMDGGFPAAATPAGSPTPAASPTTAPKALISYSGNTITLTGNITSKRTNGFQMQGGSSLGYVNVTVTSTTKITGAAPYAGENVRVTGTTSAPGYPVTATSVTQLSSSSSTPSPTATATPAPTGSVAKYMGCPVFTAGDYYNAPVTSASIDPNSANYINAVVNAGDTSGFYASTGYEKVNNATSSTPMLTVHQKVSYHSFPVPYPWASGYYIERLNDAHGMVVQTQSCHLYESYNTTYSGGVLSAYSGANWDLTKPFVPLPAGSPSAMASGLSIFAGMVKWEDYQSGSINHALNWAAVANTVAAWKFVRPASDTDGLAFKGSSSYQLPYGAHLRLKSTFSTSGMGPEATMVIKAMKTYGVYLADTGSSGNALYFANAANGTNPWNSSDLSGLSKVHVSDFEVVKLPTIYTVPGH
jgi:hypothetical protein